jgi:hypothetical protein
MKLKFVFAMLAVGGLLVSPAFADHHGEQKEKTTEAPADEMVAAYVVTAKGGG